MEASMQMTIDFKKARAERQIDAGAKAEAFTRKACTEWFINWKQASAEDLEKAFVLRLSRELATLPNYQRDIFEQVAFCTFLQIQSDISGVAISAKNMEKRFKELKALRVQGDEEARRIRR
jgi:hypothetical protein